MESEDLIEHARKLIKSGKGKPKQVELKRAISAAYYSLFHRFLKAAADDLIGSTAAARKSSAYKLIYRGFEHSRMRTIAIEAAKAQMPAKLAEASGYAQFSEKIRAAAQAFVELQQKRHSADYDPQFRFSKSDARVAIELAVFGGSMLDTANVIERRSFLLCMLMPQR
ncbi:MAG TPA: hypothetical protein VHE09_13915 [Rhizomicrobium sp.]|jgi:uncharacterized protein (UPF0332 family)|nr:hypothetical protein [Rhizomicrobium sp.]HWA04078.1 hypothetical protein [Rhizomicrobium sp.]